MHGIAWPRLATVRMTGAISRLRAREAMMPRGIAMTTTSAVARSVIWRCSTALAEE